MAETLTFAEYRIDRDGLAGIYSIGATGTDSSGILQKMSVAFEHQLSDIPSVDNLGELIGKVGPAKELQENITRVQDALGTDDNAVDIACSWAERSGLLVPVERSYLTAEPIETRINLAVITGGVRNWMKRRADRLVALNATDRIDQVLLVAGNREMKAVEGSDVEDGMTESDYMRQIVAKQTSALGIETEVIAVDSGVGDQVMDVGANRAERLVDLSSGLVAVVSNAGAWVQNVGQFRRALRSSDRHGFDEAGNQLLAVSDGFLLGTGNEPTSTHQNPFRAASQIVRNAQELVRHI
jgi:hypothetical protein